MARKSLVTGEIIRPAPPPCAHEGCNHLSICRIKTTLGWANVCDDHYYFHYRDIARKYCQERGLDTHEKQVEFIKTTLRSPGFMRPKPPARQREPGDDDEDVAI